jgi:hypothetical protein
MFPERLWECFSACAIFTCYFSTLPANDDDDDTTIQQHVQIGVRIALAAVFATILPAIVAAKFHSKDGGRRGWKLFCAIVQFASSSSLFLLICQVLTFCAIDYSS